MWFSLVAAVGEQLSPALHLGPFMKWLSHLTQHHTPGPASSSDARVQDLPLTCNVASVFWVPTSPGGGTTDCAHLNRVSAGMESPAGVTVVRRAMVQ